MRMREGAQSLSIISRARRSRARRSWGRAPCESKLPAALISALGLGVILLFSVVQSGCSLIVSQPREEGYCGDGMKGSNEACDGSDFADSTCETFNGAGSVGILHCSGDCQVETHDCTAGGVCGNGLCEASESVESCPDDCSTDLCGNDACENSENSDVCPQDCGISGICGNGIIDLGEECDGADLGFRDCEYYGFEKGQTYCSSSCRVETFLCSHPATCGDGQLDADERCDGDVLGMTCEALGYGSSGGGFPSCSDDCTFEVAQCSVPLGLKSDGASCASEVGCIGDTCIKGTFGGVVLNGYCSHSCDFGLCPGGGVCLMGGPGGPEALCFETCETAVTCEQYPAMDCIAYFPNLQKICWPSL